MHVRTRIAVSRNVGCAGSSASHGRTQRRRPKARDEEAALTAGIERLATRYGCYGYRRIRRMLVDEGWRVNVKRVWRDLATGGAKSAEEAT